MNNKLKINKLVGISIFMCLVVVLQLFSNYVTFGPVSITLALIPIVVGSIIYGPLAGFILGAVCGLTVFFAPGTIGLFWPYGIIKTFLLCILKTGIAGLVSGYLYCLFGKKTKMLGVVLSSISVPIINTGIFAVGAFFLYKDLLISFCPEGQSTLVYLLVGFIGFNFIIEFFVNSLLSPIVLRVVNIYNLNQQK